MSENKGFIERLNLVIREQFGGKPNRLATAARISPGTFSRYLEGKSTPGGENLIRIKDATGRSIDWLLTGEDKEEPAPAPTYQASPSSPGERLRTLREERLGLSREKFVEGLDISAKDLERYEKNEAALGEEVLFKIWMRFHDRIGIEGFEWLRTGAQRGAAEEEPEYKVVPLASPEEQEYLEKLLRVMRNPLTKKAIQENLNAFLLVEKPAPLDENEKKGGKAS